MSGVRVYLWLSLGVSVAEFVHPLLAAVRTVRTALAEVRDLQPLFLDPGSKTVLVAELAGARAQLDELELRVLAASGDAAAGAGARDVGSWLAATVPVDLATARATARLATGIESWAQLTDALASGMVSRAQAGVIVKALEEVAGLLTSDQRADAEALMIAEAARLDPVRLRLLGKRLAVLVGMEDGPAAEAMLVAAEQAAADRRARLSIRARGDGMAIVHGLVPDAVAHRLVTCLEAYAQPRKMAHHADGRRVPYSKLLADALRDLLEGLDPAMLPHHGGDATTIFVTMTVDQLRAELAVAGLGLGGQTITAAEARRLACQAHLIPVVLGGASEILDVGRTQRLHTPIMRKALRLRDKQCRAEGCQVPAAWCQAHHTTPWAHGGNTSVEDGILLCTHHHQRIHDPDYGHTLLPHGNIRFHRRT